MACEVAADAIALSFDGTCLCAEGDSSSSPSASQ
jgi:hypothetical protein